MPRSEREYAAEAEVTRKINQRYETQNQAYLARYGLLRNSAGDPLRNGDFGRQWPGEPCKVGKGVLK